MPESGSRTTPEKMEVVAELGAPARTITCATPLLDAQQGEARTTGKDYRITGCGGILYDRSWSKMYHRAWRIAYRREWATLYHGEWSRDSNIDKTKSALLRQSCVMEGRGREGIRFRYKIIEHGEESRREKDEEESRGGERGERGKRWNERS